jgi:hypothetical protein
MKLGNFNVDSPLIVKILSNVYDFEIRSNRKINRIMRFICRMRYYIFN